jgi:hypothetical protein
LRGTDIRPVGNAVRQTFVRRPDGWKLAADIVTPEDYAYRPWAGPRLDVVHDGNLIVVGDASSPGKAADVDATVRDDLTRDAEILDVPVNDHVLVDVRSIGSVGTFDDNESPGAITYGVLAVRNFETSAVAGLRIKINPKYLDAMLEDPVTLRHELTHFLMDRYTGADPKWLTEGIAEYVAHYPDGLASEYISQAGYDRLMKRRRELIVSGLFGQDPETDYVLSTACVDYLVQRGGVDKVEQLMSAYLTFHDGTYEDQHTGQLLHRIFGISSSELAHGAFGLLDALH